MKTYSALLALGSLVALLCLAAPPAQAQSRHSRPTVTSPTVNVNLPGSQQSTYGHSQRTGNQQSNYGYPQRTSQGNWGQYNSHSRWERMRLERLERERRERERRMRHRNNGRGWGWGR